MNDNILNETEVLILDSIINNCSEKVAKKHFLTIMEKNVNSYYLHVVYFVLYGKIIAEFEIKDSTNTFALTLSALKNPNLKTIEYEENLKKSIKYDKNNINRWARVFLFESLLFSDSIAANELLLEMNALYNNFFDPYYILIRKLIDEDSSFILAKEVFYEYKKEKTIINEKISFTEALCLYHNTEKESAMIILNEILKINEYYLLANKLKLNILFENNEFDSALDLAKKVIIFYPRDYELLWDIGCINFILNNDDYIYYLEKSISICNDEYLVSFYINEYLYMLILKKQYDFAFQYYLKNRIKVDYDYEPDKFNIIFTYFLKNDQKMAEKLYKKIIIKYPLNNEIIKEDLKKVNIQW